MVFTMATKRQMNSIMRPFYFIVVLPLFLLQIGQAYGTDPSLRKLLLADDYDFDASIGKIFSQGESSIPRLVAALDDPDETVAIHAQFMLRLIGDENGIQSLHEWYERPRPVLSWVVGPVSTPVQEWDYRQIETILAHPWVEWRGDADSYFYALAIDRSKRAQELLKRMIDAVPKDEGSSAFSEMAADLRRCGDCATSCSSGTPQKMVRKNAFFLGPEEMKSTRVELLAYANGRNLALLRLSSPETTFLVVLKRHGACWEFQSVDLRSMS
jgi:hypothetical protein